MNMQFVSWYQNVFSACFLAKGKLDSIEIHINKYVRTYAQSYKVIPPVPLVQFQSLVAL